jgi:hypothetical protein
MRPIVDPFMPTPLGMAYYLPKWSTGEGVEFDDCEQKSGTMIDYKHRYRKILSEPGIQQFIIDDLKKRALEQIAAAGSRGIRWYFAEKEAADFVRCHFYFNTRIRRGIDIQYGPFPGDNDE